jgi:hypothetical protein
MSHAGAYIKTGMAFINKLEEGKPHTSVTDWIEVLSSDRYDELSLDGIPELVESVNIQGASGTQVCDLSWEGVGVVGEAGEGGRCWKGCEGAGQQRSAGRRRYLNDCAFSANTVRTI